MSALHDGGPAAAPDDEAAAHQCVVFRIDETEYALPIGIVQEVIRHVAPARTGAGEGAAHGVIDLRGRVVPVSALASRLGDARRAGEEPPASSKIVIVDVGSGAWHGLVVDRVDEVLTIAPHHLHEAPEGVSGAIDRIANLGGRIVMLLDVDRLLAAPIAA